MDKITALLLDDEEFFLEVLIEDTQWEACGISRVKGVSSVKEAKEFLQNNTVHIILCDVEMPGEDGFSLVEWAAEYARFSKEPMVCIMLTCHPEYEYLRKAMQFGCQDYILKPIEQEDLEKSLRKAVHIVNEEFLERGEKYVEEPETGKEIIVQKVLPYIEKHISEAFTIKDLADYVSLNPQYLMRLFKKVMRVSVLDYVTQRRMNLSKEMLLSTNYTVEQIAEKTGYLTISYFSRLFKRETGFSPAQFRKEYGK